ncbi:MAG: NAD(P)-binding domain-containing protein [Aquamicrobium sp.]|uniref:NAD(P)-binding domain-containing protein n=1 Tax=Aquamicrobium sp. TaxID=1872579 RepID=UPI00349E66F6|nr:NAD(P)-binding domain-containing protein [Aquamicrobium sp.]
MKTLGFIGTGTITGAFIEGLVASGRRNPVLVSPRSAQRAEALAARFETVSRAASNAEVARDSDIVFLAMRPAQVEEALTGIDFRPGQIVCSFVTGLTVPEISAYAPGAVVCRVLPLPAVAMCKGPIIHYPRVDAVADLLHGMGQVIVPQTERELVAMGGVSGFMSTFFALQAGLVTWLEGRGVAGEAAETYVRAIFSGLAETALRSPEPLPDLVREHETKGGLNERTRKHLVSRGWVEETFAALDSVQQFSRTDLD